MTPSLVAASIVAAIYIAFLCWHHRWPARPLTADEIDAALREHADASSPDELRASVRAFMAADDGKPYYMVNLMAFRDSAVYPDGRFADVKSARHAHALYSRMVLRQLLRRGSYPVFASRRIGDFLDAGPGSDAWDQVAIVRYRSRRDMLAMIRDPEYVAGVVHKWASLERTVIFATRKLLLLDLGFIVPSVLLVLGLVAARLPS